MFDEDLSDLVGEQEFVKASLKSRFEIGLLPHGMVKCEKEENSKAWPLQKRG